ncbi:MAG: hypothetical protein EA422_12930 [Gemmatimonadales bacterium]|nr:MAG: hypothetical protein EA422_12930 [Gemmatimonadales bacterium]
MISLAARWRLGRVRRARRRILGREGERLPVSARRLLQGALPDLDVVARELPCLAVDLETTGLDPRTDGIVAVGWVAVEGDVLLGTARRRILQEDRSGGEVIHRIVHQDRASGVSLSEALEEFAAVALGRVLVAHHLAVEVGFLAAATRRVWGVEIPFMGLDTLDIERRLTRASPAGVAAELPDEAQANNGAFRLSAVRARYGLGDHRLHDALSDAVAAGELLLAQVARLEARSGRPIRLGDLL